MHQNTYILFKIVGKIVIVGKEDEFRYIREKRAIPCLERFVLGLMVGNLGISSDPSLTRISTFTSYPLHISSTLCNTFNYWTIKLPLSTCTRCNKSPRKLVKSFFFIAYRFLSEESEYNPSYRIKVLLRELECIETGFLALSIYLKLV